MKVRELTKTILLTILLAIYSCGTDTETGIKNKAEPEIKTPKAEIIEIGNSKYFEGGYSIMNQRGKKFFMDKNGNVPKELTYENILETVGGKISSMDHFHDDLSVIMKKDKTGVKWGYINRKGDNPFGKWYEYAGEFKEGIAIVKVGNVWGAIDTKGDYIIQPEYKAVSDVKKDRAWLKDSDGWKYISLPDKKVLTSIPVNIFGKEEEGVRWVEEKTEDPNVVKRAYMDKQGKILTEWYSNATDFSEGLAAFEKNDQWGFINTKGEEIIPAQFGYASDFTEGLSPFTTVDNGNFGKWGFIDAKGEIRIPMQYDFATNFRNGYAEVRNSEGKRGFINKDGVLVVDYLFDLVNNFSEGLAAVKKEGKWAFINPEGKALIHPQYDKVAPFHDEPDEGGFSGGVAKVEVDGFQFFIDKKGECVLGCLE